MSNVYSAFRFQRVKPAAEIFAVATKAGTSTIVSPFLELVGTVVAVHLPSAGADPATMVGGVFGAESHTHSVRRPWPVVMVGGATREEEATMGGTSTMD